MTKHPNSPIFSRSGVAAPLHEWARKCAKERGISLASARVYLSTHVPRNGQTAIVWGEPWRCVLDGVANRRAVVAKKRGNETRVYESGGVRGTIGYWAPIVAAETGLTRAAVTRKLRGLQDGPCLGRQWIVVPGSITDVSVGVPL